MRVHVVDPSAYTPPYDHALCAALSAEGADVELVTSAFAYGERVRPDGYHLREVFYTHARGAAGSKLRLATKLAEHVPNMLAYRRAARAADIVHFQWLPIQPLDLHLLPRRPIVLTAHDLLPREPRHAWQARAQRRLYDRVDAVVVHSEYGRRHLIDALDVDPTRLHVIPHGAFEHLARHPAEAALPPELGQTDLPVVLFFGLLRAYKGIPNLLRAWSGVDTAELWIVGRPRMPLDTLQSDAPHNVRLLTRFVSDAELAACFRRADLVVLPYSHTERLDQSGVLATALAFDKPIVVTNVGGFPEVAATGAGWVVPPDDVGALRSALIHLISDEHKRRQMSQAAHEAAAGIYSWREAAGRSIALYRGLIQARHENRLSSYGGADSNRAR